MNRASSVVRLFSSSSHSFSSRPSVSSATDKIKQGASEIGSATLEKASQLAKENKEKRQRERGQGSEAGVFLKSAREWLADKISGK